MSIDRLLAMELFVRAVDRGALAHAADEMGVARATATTLIQRLEAQLGVRLLNRTTRRMSVTPDGQAWYEQCVGILAQVSEAEERMRRQHATPRGQLRVDAPTVIARSVLMPALPRFFASYPDIDLALSCTERRADLIEERVDCALWSGELAETGILARRVGYLYFATCAAPAYLEAHGTPRHPEQLAQHRCLNRFTPGAARVQDWVFSRGAARVQQSLRGFLAVDDENSYIAAAEAGLGIAQLPAFILKDAMERGTLELVLGDWFPEPAPLSVVYPQNRHLSGKVRAFVDWVAQLLANHDGIQLRSTLRAARPLPAD
ncbi:MAG TPA: LysR family transcriptional regulator [Steroidobacteraceae bacterium]|nr:LysR family transcriptional regulator [Steroidobacteraceae bacterium]